MHELMCKKKIDIPTLSLGRPALSAEHLPTMSVPMSDEILQSILDKLTVLTTDMAAVKTDVAILKTDVGTLKTDVGTLKTDVATLKTDVATLKTDVATLKSCQVTTNERIGYIFEVQVRREVAKKKGEQYARLSVD